MLENAVLLLAITLQRREVVPVDQIAPVGHLLGRVLSHFEELVQLAFLLREGHLPRERRHASLPVIERSPERLLLLTHASAVVLLPVQVHGLANRVDVLDAVLQRVLLLLRELVHRDLTAR